MVKRQKDKQYQSRTEYKNNSQIRANAGGAGAGRRQLPFNCCALTLTTFSNPVCSSQCGVVFESTALTNFVFKYKKDPISGNSMSTRDIITLHMDKDEEERWQCPVLTKPFSDHTKIVAVLDRESNEGYVYSYEAYKELNLKTKNWHDLTTGKKFNNKRDVLIINDPSNPDFQKKRDIQTFWHIRNGRAIDVGRQKSNDVKYSVTATRIMEQIKKSSQSKETGKLRTEQDIRPSKKPKIFAEDVTGVRYTSGKASGSLTSTTMEVQNENATREASQEEILQARFKVMRNLKQKGYVRCMTNLGDMLFELHCDIVPRTCTNFLGLCQSKKYDSSSECLRMIKGFMVQLGKAGSGEDASIWGPAFQDEFDDRLKHAGRGVLSMANAGQNTNKRQFFITFKSCPHLDRKHSVFGQVVDGLSVLQQIEGLKTDKKDRPIDSLKIVKMEVLVDPSLEAEQLEEQRLEELARVRESESKRKTAVIAGQTSKKKKLEENKKPESKSGIGRYLKTSFGDEGNSSLDGNGTDPTGISTQPTKKSIATKFGDFSGW